MKMKMKFDKKAALGVLTHYGEHVVFACVVLCFLFFVYKSFARERYEKTPQDLVKAADDARKTIERTVPPPPPENEVSVKDQIEQISGKLTVTPFSMPNPFNSPIFEPRSKRGVPSLYTVEALRGTPAVGCFSARTGGGMGGPGMGGMPGMGGRKKANLDEDPEPMGKRWVMLTGLVNLKKQIEAYKECFKDAGWKNSQTDQAPVYYAFWVERAEITDAESEENSQWEQPYRSLRVEMDKCGGISASGFGANNNLLATNFIDQRLTFPLPTLTDRDWDEAVAHPPEIPLLGYGDETATDLQDPEQKEEEPIDPDDPGFELQRGRGRGGARGGMGGPGMGMGMEGGMAPGMAGRGGARGARGARGRMGQFGMSGKELSPYLLFRFIDLNVEPGKQYRYRVCIGFNNPNYNVEPRFLIDELQEIIAADKNREPRKKEWKRYIKSDWSEPSEVVAVPRDDQLLLAEVIASRKFDTEPKAKIMAVHWDMQNGMEVSDDFEDIRRGMLANFLDHKVRDPQPAPGAGGGMMGGPGMGGPGMGGPGMGEGMMEGGMGGRRPAKKQKKPRTKKAKKAGDDAGRLGAGRGAGAWGMKNNLPERVDFKTQCLVLDLRGGQRLVGKNRDLDAPGEMLLLDPDGNLVVRNDVDDFEQYLKQKYPPKREFRMGGRRGGMGGPGMGGPGMGGPGMGGPGMGGEMMGEGMMGGPGGP